MKNIILLLLLLGVAAGAYIYGLPAWEKVQAARGKLAEVEKLVLMVNEISKERDELLRRYNSISQEDIDRLNTLVPSGITREDLYVFFENLAQENSLIIRNITIVDSKSDKDKELKKLSFELEITGAYRAIRSFFDDLENNLKLMDLISIAVKSVDKGDIFTLGLKGELYYGD